MNVVTYMFGTKVLHKLINMQATRHYIMHAVEGQSLVHNEGNVLTTACTTDCLVATILILCKYLKVTIIYWYIFWQFSDYYHLAGIKFCYFHS